MSRLGQRARRRELTEDMGVETVATGEPIRVGERVDPRALLQAPYWLFRDQEALIRWAERERPSWVRTDEEVYAVRRHLARQRGFGDARREARRHGLPAPDPDDFFSRLTV